ncbi:MAG: thiamine-phosphate kinase [Acidobacteria bacterium]|nr:thiamine-phosphate kinase [Acidobacteriota bacterium]
MPLRESELIRRIRRSARASRNRVVVAGIGDDCAILRTTPGCDSLVTTDFSIEGTHFRREWHPGNAVGHRCLARGLSDIAAMGGEPRAAFLSLAIPGKLPRQWVDKFLAGLLHLARRHKVELAGGDISSAPVICADICVVGEVPRGTWLPRSGARPGDSIFVTGTLGAAAAVLQALRAGEPVSPRSRGARQHFYPEPRIAVGQYLRDRGLATAAIDVSDGFSTDLNHICQESKVAAVVHEHSLPRPTPANWLRHTSALHLALHGGDDYELLFTAPPAARIPRTICGVRVTRVGEIISGRPQILLMDSHGQRKALTPGGWQAFSE